jgi:hypothetical protein
LTKMETPMDSEEVRSALRLIVGHNWTSIEQWVMSNSRTFPDGKTAHLSLDRKHLEQGKLLKQAYDHYAISHGLSARLVVDVVGVGRLPD